MKNRIILVLALLSLLIVVTGCYEAENSAGKALNNAGSVVRTGKQKAWGEEPDAMSTGTPTPSARY